MNGRAETSISASPPRARRSRRVILIPILVVVLAAAAFFGYRYYYNSTHFVWTDNAQISGSIIQVGAMNAGEVTNVLTDVGQPVQNGQVVAKVSVPQTMAMTASGAPRVGFSTTQNQVVDVTAPLSGVVVARNADPGSTVAPGQSIVAIVDPTKLYVIANVNETDLGRIRIGEPVDVTIDSLNVTLPGRVEAITPASAASFSLIPQQNTSGNYSKVVQVVPIKVSVDYGSYPLVVGSSVEANIHVQ
jgi:multidrug resistance efflux pump